MEQPSRSSVIAMGLVTAALAGVTAWLAIGMTTGRELAGFFVSLTLFAVVLGQTLERAIKRAAGGLDEDALAIADEENTGVWFRGPGEVVTVMFDRGAGIYRVTDGRGAWSAWDDLFALGAYLADLEDAGWSAGTDVGTRLVRAALDLPGWEYAP